jgi:Zn finger protein HypA/HybF involved in hydrogenase expression
MFDSTTYLRCQACGEFVIEGEAEGHHFSCDPCEQDPAPRDHNDSMSLMEINPHLAEASGGYWGH